MSNVNWLVKNKELYTSDSDATFQTYLDTVNDIGDGVTQHDIFFIAPISNSKMKFILVYDNTSVG